MQRGDWLANRPFKRPVFQWSRRVCPHKFRVRVYLTTGCFLKLFVNNIGGWHFATPSCGQASVAGTGARRLGYVLWRNKDVCKHFRCRGEQLLFPPLPPRGACRTNSRRKRQGEFPNGSCARTRARNYSCVLYSTTSWIRYCWYSNKPSRARACVRVYVSYIAFPHFPF